MKRGRVDREAPGEHLVKELKWIHGVLRRDLNQLRRLADEVSRGASANRVQATVRSLQTRSPLWQLRVNCLSWCRLVHGHHGNEDVRIFPALRRSNPALIPAVNRLEADHRRISDLLDQVEALAKLLASDDRPETRKRLILALNDVRGGLLAHLDLEEATIIPTVRRWRDWPR
ncbi:hemerythrin HHE cation binding domain-containing protein [Micromonospora pisi]|uniref:Hemerythrin HHE cation binding domain-containing protein n=1 Tax=Micromonospora pisi TaxID=589240 RepID=A0A495JFZ9_9ACTN|nr:hemerythrin domain-containing protein [Micromonospora pisi]RKR87837.1 hemerythrin HHE cation binding domain-containing protein [Micromonospora pisi]